MRHAHQCADPCAVRSSRLPAVALAATLLAPAPLLAAELRPYSLPSQQQQQVFRPQEAPAQNQAPAQAQAAAAPSPEYYQDYADWARQLKPQQRAELAHGFERDARRAVATGHGEEARHYRRLVTILRSLH